MQRLAVQHPQPPYQPQVRSTVLSCGAASSERGGILVGPRLPFERIQHFARLTHEYLHIRGFKKRRLPSGSYLNHVRHALTRYDEMRVGASPNETDAIRRRVDAMIVATYPELTDVA